MPTKKPAAAETAPQKGAAKLFLVYGTDDLSATRKADELAAQLCPPEEQAFGLETLQPEPGTENADAVCAFLRNVVEALLTLPFLGGNKTVFVRGAPFFDPLTEPGKFTSVKAEVERLVDLLKKGLPEGVAFILLTDKVNKSTTFYKTFSAAGEVHVFDEPEKDKEAQADFIPRAEQMLADRGLAMPRTVFNALLDRTGYNLRQVENEIEKLALYVGDRKTVAAEDVRLMVAPMRESKFWEFADTFCGGDLADTLQMARRMFAQGVSPVALIVGLQNRLREIVVLADCLKRGWARVSGGDWPKLTWSLPPEGEALLAGLAKDPRKGHPFAVAKMAAQANRLPPARWYRWLNAAVDAQAAMTGGAAVDPEVALEVFATRILGELAADKAPASRAGP
ncbi:MAG: DNA polymerase III subunit delta [Kiritimatiellia bacterium]